MYPPIGPENRLAFEITSGDGNANASSEVRLPSEPEGEMPGLR
jgi:hypothetical protein